MTHELEITSRLVEHFMFQEPCHVLDQGETPSLQGKISHKINLYQKRILQLSVQI